MRGAPPTRILTNSSPASRPAFGDCLVRRFGNYSSTSDERKCIRMPLLDPQTFVTGHRSRAPLLRKKAGIVILGAILAAAVAGCSTATLDASAVMPAPTPSPTTSHSSPAKSADDLSTVTEPAQAAAIAIADSSNAISLLATLPIKGRAPMTGYARTAMFGAAWIDEDRNGCDTRNDILSRDLTDLTKSGPCRVLSGSLISPYTGRTISFVRGNLTSTAVQIDHVVSLGDAWRTGAQQLSQAQRVAIANDPINLFAVDAHSNLQKSDGDTATWLPESKPFRCTYVSHQVSVKATYALWVTQPEHDAMLRVLSNCADTPAITSPTVPAPAAPAPAAPAPPASATVPAVPAVVHPGAFCSGDGATGVTSKGTAMRCSYKPGDQRLRWRST